jgi:hypothetical protein
MKFKITFEVDATGTAYEIKDKNDEVPAVLQNLGQWFYELHLRFLEQSCDNQVRLDRAKTKQDTLIAEAIIKHNDEQIKLSEQLFNNYKIEGTMSDGKSFTFTHTEPGYKETMTFHP